MLQVKYYIEMAENSALFSTQLSLHKFTRLAKRLTFDQQALVKEIGYDGTLKVCCEELPRSLVKWLVMHFHVPTTTFRLPNGCSFQLLPFHLNKVIGLPFGGRRINPHCPQWVRDMVRGETGCIGNSPTINELDRMITPYLLGEKFKIAFTLFANTVMLFPTSYEAASPQFMSGIAIPDDIKSYDWAGAAFDLLVSSIHKFQSNGFSGALCGFLPAIVVSYSSDIVIIFFN